MINKIRDFFKENLFFLFVLVSAISFEIFFGYVLYSEPKDLNFEYSSIENSAVSYHAEMEAETLSVVIQKSTPDTEDCAHIITETYKGTISEDDYMRIQNAYKNYEKAKMFYDREESADRMNKSIRTDYIDAGIVLDEILGDITNKIPLTVI